MQLYVSEEISCDNYVSLVINFALKSDVMFTAKQVIQFSNLKMTMSNVVKVLMDDKYQECLRM
jgi:hypothetical protein